MVVHIVNDKTPNWGGGGFAEALKKRWPATQTDFRKMIAHHRRFLALGNARICSLPDGVLVASVVAQKGYGESVSPPHLSRHTPQKRTASAISMRDEHFSIWSHRL